MDEHNEFGDGCDDIESLLIAGAILAGVHFGRRYLGEQYMSQTLFGFEQELVDDMKYVCDKWLSNNHPQHNGDIDNLLTEDE